MTAEPSREDAERTLSLLEERMARYEKLIDDLKADRIDAAAFRRAAVATGIVVEWDGAWIFDLANTRWLHYDGVELRPMRSDPPSKASRKGSRGAPS